MDGVKRRLSDNKLKGRAKTREMLIRFFEMNNETADRFMECFAKFNPESIKNEYYSDLLTWLKDDMMDNTSIPPSSM